MEPDSVGPDLSPHAAAQWTVRQASSVWEQTREITSENKLRVQIYGHRKISVARGFSVTVFLLSLQFQLPGNFGWTLIVTV